MIRLEVTADLFPKGSLTLLCRALGATEFVEYSIGQSLDQVQSQVVQPQQRRRRCRPRLLVEAANPSSQHPP